MDSRKLPVTLHRSAYALAVLVLMPEGAVKTAGDPHAYHIVLLAVSGALTAASGALYRRAVTKWMEEDE